MAPAVFNIPAGESTGPKDATITFSSPEGTLETGRGRCYDDVAAITSPAEGAAFDGQDAQHDGNAPSHALGGDALNVFTRILRIADAFDSATSNAFSQAKSPIRVLWEMSVGQYRHLYDPVLMTVFRRIIQPFPIGAKLRLTDGQSAVVTKHNRECPFDPTVIVAFDREGERISSLVPPALLSEQSLTIKSFQGEHLGYLQYGAGDEPLSPPSKFRTLFEAFYP